MRVRGNKNWERKMQMLKLKTNFRSIFFFFRWDFIVNNTSKIMILSTIAFPNFWSMSEGMLMLLIPCAWSSLWCSKAPEVKGKRFGLKSIVLNWWRWEKGQKNKTKQKQQQQQKQAKWFENMAELGSRHGLLVSHHLYHCQFFFICKGYKDRH